MTVIPFTKMSAAGNDFIIIDNRLHTIAADRGSELLHIYADVSSQLVRMV